ncbi:unnamed protein product [Paramecium primaurelia]|uniref:Uncharacterized protein n=1 Tax=Paramecium primaurelia TaxID=5886 RepID=A0A8S1L4E4_PARPR|nr:unnamed protein product [Paramecium primaurelia]
MNNRLLYFGFCDATISLIAGIVSFIQTSCCFNFNIIFIAELILMIAFIILQYKRFLNDLIRETFLGVSYLLCQILQIEYLGSLQSSEYILFLCLRLFILTTQIERITFRIILFSVTYFYLVIRLQFYLNMFPYLGLAYVPLIFIIDQSQENLSSSIIDFFQTTLTNPLLILDAQTREPLFHTNQMESQFNYTSTNQDYFIQCLQQFQDSSQKTLRSIFDEQKLSYEQKSQVQYLKLKEISNEDYYYVETQQNKKLATLLQDEINQEKHELINFDSPKSQIENLKFPVSNQFNDDNPKYGKSKFRFKDSQYKLFGINELKQKRINIIIQYCIWKNKEAFMISLKDLENQKLLQILTEELEESKKQNENKDQILATVFHDFKTPINGICTIVEAMEEKYNLNAASKYYLRIIRKNVYLMLYMIYDILDFARIQKNQLRLSVSNFYLNEVIDEVIELIAIQAEQKGVVIQTHYDIPSYQIYSDPNRIKQILMNFISNSLKFTEQGSIKISVESLQTDKANHIVRAVSSKNVLNQQQNQQTIGQLRKQLSGKSFQSQSGQNRMVYTISIQDTGCGISDLIKPKLFNMYATFPSKDVQNKSGTGIGLMVCKKLIKLLGPSEKIELWSEQNKGTKMSFQIYSRLPDDPKRSPNYISVFKQESSSKNFNVESSSLIDEQEQMQQKFVRSSVLRVYTRPVDKNDTEAGFDFNPEYEDEGQQKLQNINILQNLRSPTPSRIKIKEQNLDDSQEIIDPRSRLQRILQNKIFTILIVDDQPFNVLALKLLLQDISSNVSFLEAYNGQQAVNKLQTFQKSKNIKYVLMDLFMPILNGWKAATKIREMIAQQLIEDVKIIAISGFDDESEQERCENVGFDAFITKPVKLEMIAEVFAQLEYN